MVNMTAQRTGARTCLIVSLTGLLLSCNIFSPRPSQQPNITVNPDPLSIKTILMGTGEKFSAAQLLEDLFENDLAYEDINSGTYSKSQCIQRLQQIQIQNATIKILWVPGQVWKNANSDTLVLTGLKYRVYLSGNTGMVPNDSGSSNFSVAKGLEWRIFQWRDIPGRPGKSFFSP